MPLDQTYSFSVTNLSCAGCAGRAQRAIAALDGAGEATVNFANRKATVPAGGVGAGMIQEALEKAGYPAEIESIALDVDGMTCATCVGKVERALTAVPGVLSAAANLASGRAEVRVLGGSATAADLRAALAGIGYAARPAGDPGESAPRRASEAETLRRQTLLAALLTLPVFVLEMGGHLIPAFHHWVAMTIGTDTSRLIQFALTTAVLAGPGLVFYRRGIPALLRGAPDMNALVALGTAAAWMLSTVATFAPGLLPDGAAHVYFEAAAVIVTLILLGRTLEARAKGKTGAAIERLLRLQPDTATVLRDGSWQEIPAADLVEGDTVRIRPGARIPTDGEVTEGRSNVDESMMTGEPVPVARGPGDSVVAGTVNGTGSLTVRTTRVGADTTLARIVRMVEQAQAAKLPVQALADRVTLWFVPVVIGLALLTLVLWLALGPAPTVSNAVVAAVSVLVIACPCALGLATPTSIMAGTGRAAEMGVLFRKGDALQSLEGVRTVAFDKTGTLTEGRPDVTAIAVATGIDEAEVLEAAAALEARSEHPLATAILRAAEAQGLGVADAAGFQSTTGGGVSGVVAGRKVTVGNRRHLTEAGIDTAALDAAADTFADDGRTAVFVGIDGTAAGVLAISDPIRPGAPEAIAALHRLGLKTALITGDTERAANAVAKRLGIDTVRAGVLPGGKVAALDDLRKAGPLAFVGDGINDAPALAAADVGLAVGTGTDVAIEAGDLVLATAEPAAVVRALAISRATMRNIRQNLFWAFGYNVALIPVAMGALYPAFGLLLSPMLAAGAMALSSVFVVTNALRLTRARLAS